MRRLHQKYTQEGDSALEEQEQACSSCGSLVKLLPKIPPGDCHKTAVACCLDLPWESVPHFAYYREFIDAEDEASTLLFWYALVGFCRSIGYDVEYVPFEDDEFEEKLLAAELATMGGKSPRGDWGHEIVIKPEFWDPHPSGRGVEEIYGITIYTPSRDFLPDGGTITP